MNLKLYLWLCAAAFAEMALGQTTAPPSPPAASSAALTRTGIKRAQEAEVLARARTEITRRGLAAAVTRAYYALLTAQRKYATAQQALDEAKRYFDVSQNLEHGGEVAHSDTVKADLQVAAQDQAFRESKLAMENARLDLAVM